jgi:hypothetical protein
MRPYTRTAPHPSRAKRGRKQPWDLPHVRDFLLRLNRVVPLDAVSWYADCPCPTHRGDPTGRLGVGVTRNGSRLVIKCVERCCSERQILDALGLTRRELAPEVLDVATIFGR